MFNKKDNNRFKKIYEQGSISRVRIIVNTETGVHYLNTMEGYAGGLTVLLGKDGKPVISQVEL